MKKKVLFFDIDGTLTNFEGIMPTSTYKALLQAKSNGHKIVLCTGRSRFQINDNLLKIGFHGIIGAAGAYVEAEGVQIYHHTLAQEPFRQLLHYLDKRGILYLLQTKKCGVTTSECFVKLTQLLENEMKMPVKNIRDIFGEVELAENISERDDIEKLIYYASPDDLKQVRSSISPYFGLNGLSFDNTAETRGEISCMSETKASGMKHYLEYISENVEDSIAFGDGPNDFEMMEFAGISVAMGNAKDALKEKADMVTDSVDESGIYNALKKLDLIK